MNKKYELYNLVKSLNANEKRFFKLYAKLHNNNKTPQYVYVFNILDKSEAFNSDQINAEISKVIPKNNISRIKQYLKYHIFEALKAYHKKGSGKLQENEDINIAEILVQKKMYAMAEKILLKLRKNAIETENFDLHFRANTKLSNLSITKNFTDKKLSESIKQYYDECLLSLDQTKELLKLRLIAAELNILFNSSDLLEGNLYDRATQILEKDLSEFDKNKLLSNKSKLSYYSILHGIYLWLHRKEDYIKMTEQLKQIVESSSFQHHPQTILFTYANILESYIDYKLTEPFYPVLNKAQSVIDKNIHIKVIFQHWLYIRELEFHSYVIAKNPDQKVIDKIMSYINTLENADNKNVLLVSLAICYFLNGRYESCQDTMLEVTLENDISINSSYFLRTYLMEILCYWELDVSSLAKQKYSILKRKIKKLGTKNTAISSIINSLKAIIKSKKMNLQNLEALNNLLEIKENEGSPIFKDDLKFLSVWVKKKIAVFEST